MSASSYEPAAGGIVAVSVAGRGLRPGLERGHGVAGLGSSPLDVGDPRGCVIAIRAAERGLAAVAHAARGSP